MHICTFAGHSFVFSATVEDRLKDEIEAYLADIDEVSFYVGGRGEFDGMAAAVVRAAKARHKDKKIQLYTAARHPVLTTRLAVWCLVKPQRMY